MDFNYECYDLSLKSQYNEIILSFKNKIYDNVIIIYSGHGDGNLEEDYPAVCPVKKSFNIIQNYNIRNTNGEIIKFKYIFDCCNISNFILNNNNEEEKEYKNQIILKLNNFINLDFNYICVRKGIYNWTDGSFTRFNKILIDVLLNYNYSDVEDFLSICNYYMLGLYKQRGEMNKKYRYVIDSDINYNKIKNIQELICLLNYQIIK